MTISEEEVSVERLGSLAQTAVIDFEIDEDGDLYVTDGLEFPCWVRIIDDERLITFFTYLTVDHDPDCGLTLTNNMNKSVAGVQFHWRRKRVWGQQWMSYDSGLNVRQFVKTLRRFSSSFKTGMLLETAKTA